MQCDANEIGQFDKMFAGFMFADCHYAKLRGVKRMIMHWTPSRHDCKSLGWLDLAREPSPTISHVQLAVFGVPHALDIEEVEYENTLGGRESLDEMWLGWN